jgi:hypothetical protein
VFEGVRRQGPARRRLKIFPYDPVLGRVAGNRICIDVANETALKPGPAGQKIEVIDYDSTFDTFYPPVDLNAPDVLMTDGLDPSEGDHRFHQQMVYAVAMKTIENFERALGREIRFRKNRPLKMFPHAFRGANAFYDPETRSIFFGYFRADEQSSGPNIPKQWVFTCLSHDVIAHETTHAIVDKLRFRYRSPTNRDALAFHEAIADIVAIFQHFTFPEVLKETIRTTRADIRSASPLIELAVQFGHGTGRGKALRSAVDAEAPDPALYSTASEPHDRGSILVAAVFDGFFHLYQSRIQDLVRLATGGTGTLPEGALHPDLVERAAAEAAGAADEVLRVCLRAFDYLPVLDVDFGDFLRALVTADMELFPQDKTGRRAALIEAFRARGIYAYGVTSLGEDALSWPSVDERTVAEMGPLGEEIRSLILPEITALDRLTSDVPEDAGDLEPRSRTKDTVYGGLYDYAKRCPRALGLEGTNIAVSGFNPTFRVGEDGKLRTEIVVQWTDEVPPDRSLGGLDRTAGTTVVFTAEGTPRYIVPKPWPHEGIDPQLRGLAQFRRARMLEFVRATDERTPDDPWADDDYRANRMVRRYGFASLHRSTGLWS